MLASVVVYTALSALSAGNVTATAAASWEVAAGEHIGLVVAVSWQGLEVLLRC